MASTVCQSSLLVTRSTRVRALQRVQCAAPRQLHSLAAMSIQAAVQRRSVARCSSTSDIGIQELKGLCMDSLRGLGYTRDEASILTEVRPMTLVAHTRLPSSSITKTLFTHVAVWNSGLFGCHCHSAAHHKLGAFPSTSYAPTSAYAARISV
jgi:hypothetical protein